MYHNTNRDEGRTETKENLMTTRNLYQTLGGLLCSGFAIASFAWGGEAPPPVKSATPAVQVVPAASSAPNAVNVSLLPPPKIDPPPMPVDGSGVYRLSLEGAIGAPLIVLVEVRQGKLTRAVALPTHYVQAWGEADTSQLIVEGERLHGKLRVSFSPLWNKDLNSRQIAGKPNPKFSAFTWKPVQQAEFAIDVAKISQGTGAYTATWNGPPAFFNVKLGKEGRVFVDRTPLVPAPDRCEVDLYLTTALTDMPLAQRGSSSVLLRVAFAGEKATGSMGYVSPLQNDDQKLTISECTATLRDGRLTGRFVAASPKVHTEAFTLEVDGQMIGSQLYGLVTCSQGDLKAVTPWIGVMNDSAFRWPTAPWSGSWTWKHDLSADAALTAAAQEESLRPVLPGEPGKTGFWTWRSLVRHSNVSTIHPPSFDIKETAEAAQYRYRVVGGAEGKKMIELTFEADKPWKPLTPIWKDMPPGNYQLTVTAIDAKGAALPGPMRLGILDKESAEPTAQAFPVISLIKRPAFSGPYATPPSSWTDLAIRPTRWYREAIGYGHTRGQDPGGAFFTGGEGGFGHFAQGALWGNLAARALTTDPAERRMSEDALKYYVEECEIHQQMTRVKGVFHMYKGYTALNHLTGRAVLDAWLQTGDPRWKEIALKLGRGLVTLQRENGAFNSSNTHGGERPGGYFATWAKGNTEFGTSELLYLFGRLRRDLKTDEFLEAERKAHQWMERAVRDRYFPIYDHHSMSQQYPVWQHAHSALMYCRYLLECAPPDKRDVKFIEEIALWAEDHNVNWRRDLTGQTHSITPHIGAADRTTFASKCTMLAAIVFHELSLATGSRLWAAKSEALATAVVQSIDPETGWLNVNFKSVVDAPYKDRLDLPHLYYFLLAKPETVQLLREYAVLRNMKP